MSATRLAEMAANPSDEKGTTVARKTTKVRTTFTPGEVIAVDAAELLDLERQGLIHSQESDDNWQPEVKPEAAEPDAEPSTTPSKRGGKA